jgi:hypothetical protein
MRSNGIGGDSGKRRGKRRHKGRGGFSNSNAGFVLSAPAAPAAQGAPECPAAELIDTAVIEDLPEPWDEAAGTALQQAEPDTSVAVAEEPVDIELQAEPPQPKHDIPDDDLLLLEELTRPHAPLTTDAAPATDEPAPIVADPAPIIAATAPIDAQHTVAAVQAVPSVVEPPAAAPQPSLIVPPHVTPQEPASPAPDRESVVAPVPEANCESAAAQLLALQAELLEKDQLLAALTAQLEEAANRLDRLHRAGADRAPRRSGLSLSAEAMERQSELTDQVARLADAWDQWRAADQMTELGRKLDELSQLVSQTARSASAPPRDAASSRFTDSWTGDFDLPPPLAEKPLPKWEQMKAQLLGDSAVIEQPWDLPPPVEMPAGSQAEIDLGVVVEPIGEPPAAVNVDSADLDTLKRAVEERDDFISQLLRRLRSTPACRREPINWAAIANAPDDLRSRLEELEARFQELLRIEECDMSLERARLARERARLEHLRRELEKNGGRHGADSDTSQNDDSRRERRWLRVFSFGGKRDDDLD